MSLYWRLRRWLGHDAMTEKVHEQTLYEYTVTHLNGNVTTERAHLDTRDNGFLQLWENDNETWAVITLDWHFDITCKPAFAGPSYGRDKVAELEGIESVTKEPVATDRWIFSIDKADGSFSVTTERVEKM